MPTKHSVRRGEGAMSERPSERASERKKLCTLLSRRQEDGAEFSEFGKEWQQNVVDESKQDTIARTELEGGGAVTMSQIWRWNPMSSREYPSPVAVSVEVQVRAMSVPTFHHIISRCRVSSQQLCDTLFLQQSGSTQFRSPQAGVGTYVVAVGGVCGGV